MEEAKRVRRWHSPEFKRQVLAECEVVGASVAAVALTHGVNANLVHKWRRQGQPGVPEGSAKFIPITVAASAAPVVPSEPGCIEIQMRRGGTAIQVRWPLAAAAGCADWLRAWLG